MEMHQIRYFLAVTDHFNFTRAAETCNVSQPSLTRAIKLLEDELGGPLFHRERNQTHLSDLGREMLPFLAKVWEQAEAAKCRARGLSRLEQARLSLGVMCTIGPAKMIDFVGGFHARHPGVDIHMRDARGQVLQEQLLAGEIDVAIFALPGEIDERLLGRRLFTERFMITVAPGHRFERMNAVPMRELDNERYLNRANCEFGEHAGHLMAECGVRLHRRYRTERDDWIQAMVMAGLGFGFTPEFAMFLPGVVVRPLVDPEISRTVQLVTVRGRPHSPALAALVREATTYRWAP